MNKIEFRCDDVLQWLNWGARQTWLHQKLKLDPFKMFVEADEVFKKYNHSYILAIVVEGIDIYPEWVEYIKKNQHRYKIELHGYFHHCRRGFQHLPEDRLYTELSAGIRRIKEVFGVEVTYFIPNLLQTFSVYLLIPSIPYGT